jgi:hypothetical protein
MHEIQSKRQTRTTSFVNENPTADTGEFWWHGNLYWKREWKGSVEQEGEAPKREEG